MSNNLAIIQDAYQAFARGDVPAVLGILDATIQWTESEGSAYGGT